MRCCTKCNLTQPIENYSKFKGGSNGLAYWCKSCATLDAKRRYKKNRDRLLAQKKLYNEANKDAIKEWFSEYKAKPEYRQQRRHYWKKSGEDPLKLLTRAVRSRMSNFLRLKKITVVQDKYSFIGTSVDILKRHIERQFEPGMNWSNHGNGVGKWNIDHIIPLSYAKTEADLVQICHYTNLRPMWAIENIKKGSKIVAVQTQIAI